MNRIILAFALILACSTSHAALRTGNNPATTPRPTTPPPTNPTPVTGGGSPTLICTIYPLSCVQ